MGEVVYFLIPEKATSTIERDFDSLVSRLKSGGACEVDESGNVTILWEGFDQQLTARLKIVRQEVTAPSQFGPYISVATTRANDQMISAVREEAKMIGYRVFCAELGCFLPESIYLHDLITSTIDRVDEEIILKFGLESVFYTMYFGKTIIYARNKSDRTIHIVNPYILDYYHNFGFDKPETDEFSYQVASNIQQFASLFDAKLIPVDFYSGFKKKDRIFNGSHFDIESPGRKVFVKPLIYELDDLKGKFYMKVGEKGSVILMDKIRPGENLDRTLKRFLRENSLADDYIGAIVMNEVEFDRDKEGILTPRLQVLVYVEKIGTIPPELKRTWESIK